MVFHIVIKKVTATGSTNTFVINNLGSLSLELSTPLTPMPLPEESDEETILVKMEGNTQTIPLSWTLKTETNPMIGSNDGGGVSFARTGMVWGLTTPDNDTLTQFEQINWLQGAFAPNSVDDGYTFEVFDDAEPSAVYTRSGSFTNFRFSISGNSPVVWDANVSFIVGDPVAAFESNSPERPTFKSLTSTVAGEADVTWKSFAGYASGETPTYTNSDIRYKKVNGGNWITLDTGILGAATDKTTTVTGLITGAEYIFKVADNNLESDDTNLRNFSISRRIVVA